MPRKAFSPGRTGPERIAVVKTSRPPLSHAAMMRKLTSWESRYQVLMETREELIKEAWDAGIPVGVLAACFHVGVERIYQIKDDKYPRSPRKKKSR